jgi:hypothetical protein
MDQNQVYLIKSGQNSFVETETEITVGISGGKLGIGTTHPEADFHVTGNTQIDGDLTVKGDFTTINQTTIDLDDKNISLGVGATSDAHADGGGITVKGATDKTITFVTGADGTSDDAWEFNQNVQLENGKKFIGEQLQSSSSLNLLDSTETGITISNGKVGVNKTSPVADFDVDGSGNFSEGLFVDGNSVLTGDSSVLGKWTDGSTQGEIYYNQGNVGIGLQDPSYALDVNGSTNINGEFFVKGTTGTFNVEDFLISGDHIEINSQGNSLTSNRGGIIVNDSNNAQKTFEYVEGSNFWQSSESLQVVGGKHIQTDAVRAINADGLSLQDDGGNGIFIEDGGNVGIGTTNPSYSLDVNGSVNVDGSFTLQNEFNFGSNGAVGGIAPAAVDDIIKWNGIKWVAGANPGGGGGGGSSEVPNALINSIASGESSQFIQFLDIYNTAPRIATDLEINGEGAIIPYSISGVSTSGYHVTFAQEVPNNNYKIHTVFGGKDVYWETGASNSIYYNDGDVSLQRNLVVGGNLTVNGTETIVNTQTVEIEDHNIVIASNTGYNQLTNEYPSAGGAYAGILWGTGDAGGASPVSLTYQHNNGFAFEGGNVGIGATNPSGLLHLESVGPALYITDTTYNTDAVISSNNGGDIILNADLNNVSDSNNPSKIQFKIDGDHVMLIRDGNVGIGTTNPDRNLVIDAGANSGPVRLIARSTDEACAIQIRNSANTATLTQLGANVDSYFNGGNVGIGTTNPNVKLHIEDTTADDITSGAGRSGAVLRLTHNANWQSSYNTGGSTPDFLGGIEFESTDISSGTGVRTAIKTTVDHYANLNSLAFYTAPSSTAGVLERMRIDSSGNVGIGTTSPSSKLHITATHSDTNSIDNLLTLEAVEKSGQNLEAGDGLGILFKVPVGNNETSAIGARIAAVKEGGTENATSTELVFEVSQQDETLDEAMRIDRDGNVGIGTTDPSAKLEVLQSSETNTLTEVASFLGGNYSSVSNAESFKFFHQTTSLNTNRGVAFKSVNGSLQIQTIVSSSNTSASNNISLQPDGGNVGIGTTSPDVKLHILTASSAEFALKAYNSTSTGHGAFIKGGGSSGQFRLKVESSENTDAPFVVTGDGNVGIGTTNPTGILHLEGPLPNLKIRSTSDWSATTGPVINLQGKNSSGATKYFGGIKAYSLGTDKGELAFNIRKDNIKTDLEAMRINSSGNVGIGTTNAGSKLDIYDSTAQDNAWNTLAKFRPGLDDAPAEASIYIQSYPSTTITADRKTGIQSMTNNNTAVPLIINKDGGNVGIGTTNPIANLEIFSAVKPIIRLTGTGNNALNTNFGEIQFYNRDGSGDGPNVAASIHAQSHSSTGAGGSLVFSTEAAPAGAATEGQPAEPRMTILSDGNVGIGTTSPAANLHIDASAPEFRLSQSGTAKVRLRTTGDNYINTGQNLGIGTTSPVVKLHIKGSEQSILGHRETTTASHDLFTLNSDVGSVNSTKFKIEADGKAYTGASLLTSDDRLKHKEQEIFEAIETLSKITPKKYIKTSNLYEPNHDLQFDENGNPIDENGDLVPHHIEAGVIAQQVLNIPELKFLVREEKLDEDGNTVWPYSLDYNSLFTYAIAAIQEQQTIIEDLKSQNASLESRISALES